LALTILSKSLTERKIRVLFSGEPNSGKSYSLNTFSEEGEVHIISYPDEKGVRSLPVGDNFHVYTFTYEPLPDDAKEGDYFDLLREKQRDVEILTRQLIKGEFGKVDVLVGDGLLKYYEICMGRLSRGKFTKGDPFETSGSYTTRLFGSGHQVFKNYLGEIYHSSIPLFIGTTWVKYDFEEENLSDSQKRDQMKQGGQKLFPHLPGQMRRDVIGEFDASILCTWSMFNKCATCAVAQKNNKPFEKEEHRVWQLCPFGDAQFVGIKDARIGKKYPIFIHQDWKILKSLMG